MSKYIQAILIILYLLVDSEMMAQTSERISGIISDQKGKIVADAVVVVRDSLTDTHYITYTDRLGYFEVAVSRSLVNQIIVTRLGYITAQVPLMNELDSQQIIMVEDDSYNLDEVLVSAHRTAITMKNGRLIYHMDANPFKKDNVLESFKFVPMLSSNGEIFSIIGKGSTKVYMNGREILLSGDALSSYLRSYPADKIKLIEVIFSPNSTFRGEGDFGIINIVLKDSENEGFRGLLSTQLWRTHNFKERGSLALMYQKNKLTMSLLAGISNQSDWKKVRTENSYKENLLRTMEDGEMSGLTRSYWGMIDLDYKLSDRNVLGFSLDFSYGKVDRSDNGQMKFYENSGKNPTSRLKYDNDINNDRININTNVNYRRSFDNPGTYLNIDFDYVYKHAKQFNWARMDKVDQYGIFISPHNYYKEIAPQASSIWSGKVEYGFKKEHYSLKLGLDSYFSQIDNDDAYQKCEGDVYLEDVSKSNHFSIDEWTSSLFFHLEKNWKECFSLGLGCRFEYTAYTMNQHTTDEMNERNYWKLLPGLYLTYNLSPQHVLSYSLTNRIQRPSFSLLNPFKIYTSPTNYSTGNTQLDPEHNLNQTIQYQFNKRFMLQASYLINFDHVNGLNFVKENNMIESKPVNIGRYDKFLLQFNANTSYFDNWANLNATAGYKWQRMGGVKDENLNMGYVSNGFEANLSNNFIFSKKHNLSFNLNLSFSTSQTYYLTESPTSASIHGELKKQIRNWQLVPYGFVNLYFYDKSATAKYWRQIYDTDSLKTVTFINGESWGIGIRLSYSFGNSKVKGVKERNTSGSEARSRL